MPVRSSANDEGVELSIRQSPGQDAQTLLRSASDEPSAMLARRRTTMADLRSGLKSLENKHPEEYYRAKVAMACFTLARISTNLSVIVFAERFAEHVGDQFHLICDSTLRPVVSGLGIFVFLHKMERFSSKNQLHFLSLVTVVCLAVPFFDVSVVYALLAHCHMRSLVVIILWMTWEIFCNILQVRMTTLKLQALGWRQTAKCCDTLAALGGGSFVLLVAVLLASRFSRSYDHGIVPIVCLCYGFTFLTLALQCWALCRAASTSMVRAASDDATWWTAFFLYANACLVLLGPALSFASLSSFFRFMGHLKLPWMMLTVDVTFQVLNVLLLSGMLGTIPLSLEALQQLAELSGFGLASKRIAFPGHITDNKAADCIVSFPGKYSELWDAAVKSVEKDAFSLACVFLTDAASGLGKHAENPDTPGKCWCHQIYGPMQALAYLRMVDLRAQDGQSRQEALAEEKEDAKAMGQRLLPRLDQGDVEWEREVAEALQEAEERCAKNHALAPWGCHWFEAWKSNVDKAKERKQVLHIFYFEGMKGKGKMHWELLHKLQAARKDSGLGVSQTAEVAYLDKIGLSYVEHDIREFEDFLASHPNKQSFLQEWLSHSLLG